MSFAARRLIRRAYFADGIRLMCDKHARRVFGRSSRAMITSEYFLFIKALPIKRIIITIRSLSPPRRALGRAHYAAGSKATTHYYLNAATLPNDTRCDYFYISHDAMMPPLLYAALLSARHRHGLARQNPRKFHDAKTPYQRAIPRCVSKNRAIDEVEHYTHAALLEGHDGHIYMMIFGASASFSPPRLLQLISGHSPRHTSRFLLLGFRRRFNSLY